MFTGSVTIGLQVRSMVNGIYRLEGARLILQPDGGVPFSPAFQMQGDGMVIDVPNFAQGLGFVRQRNNRDY